MNLDLSKGTIANVLALGVGLLFFGCLFFAPEHLDIFSSPRGYIFGVLLGFVVLPYMRLREAKRFIVETQQVIDAMAKLLELDKATRRLARPAYDFFLRAIPQSKGIIERVHDLGAQARLNFAVSRLLLVVAAMAVVAGGLKFAGSFIDPPAFPQVLSYLGHDRMALGAFSVSVVVVALTCASGFQKRGESIVARQRNLERMALLNNIQTVQAIRDVIKNNASVIPTLFFFSDIQDVPNAPHAP